jgi:hypothetical protein
MGFIQQFLGNAQPDISVIRQENLRLVENLGSLEQELNNRTDQFHDQVHRLMVVLEQVRRSSETVDFQGFVDRIWDSLCFSLGIKSGGVLVLRNASWECLREMGLQQSQRILSLSQDGIFLAALENFRPYHGRLPDPFFPKPRSDGSSPVLVCPFRIAGMPLGALVIDEYVGGIFSDEHELTIAQTLTSILGLYLSPAEDTRNLLEFRGEKPREMTVEKPCLPALGSSTAASHTVALAEKVILMQIEGFGRAPKSSQAVSISLTPAICRYVKNRVTEQGGIFLQQTPTTLFFVFPAIAEGLSQTALRAFQVAEDIHRGFSAFLRSPDENILPRLSGFGVELSLDDLVPTKSAGIMMPILSRFSERFGAPSHSLLQTGTIVLSGETSACLPNGLPSSADECIKQRFLLDTTPYDVVQRKFRYPEAWLVEESEKRLAEVFRVVAPLRLQARIEGLFAWANRKSGCDRGVFSLAARFSPAKWLSALNLAVPGERYVPKTVLLNHHDSLCLPYPRIEIAQASSQAFAGQFQFHNSTPKAFPGVDRRFSPHDHLLSDRDEAIPLALVPPAQVQLAITSQILSSESEDPFVHCCFLEGPEKPPSEAVFPEGKTNSPAALAFSTPDDHKSSPNSLTQNLVRSHLALAISEENTFDAETPEGMKACGENEQQAILPTGPQPDQVPEVLSEEAPTVGLPYEPEMSLTPTQADAEMVIDGLEEVNQPADFVWSSSEKPSQSVVKMAEESPRDSMGEGFSFAGKLPELTQIETLYRNIDLIHMPFGQKGPETLMDAGFGSGPGAGADPDLVSFSEVVLPKNFRPAPGACGEFALKEEGSHADLELSLESSCGDIPARLFLALAESVEDRLIDEVAIVAPKIIPEIPSEEATLEAIGNLSAASFPQELPSFPSIVTGDNPAPDVGKPSSEEESEEFFLMEFASLHLRFHPSVGEKTGGFELLGGVMNELLPAILAVIPEESRKVTTFDDGCLTTHFFPAPTAEPPERAAMACVLEVQRQMSKCFCNDQQKTPLFTISGGISHREIMCMAEPGADPRFQAMEQNLKHSQELGRRAKPSEIRVSSLCSDLSARLLDVAVGVAGECKPLPAGEMVFTLGIHS